MNIKQYIEDSKAKTAEGIWKTDFRYPVDNPVIKSLDFFEDEVNRPGQIKGWWTEGDWTVNFECFPVEFSELEQKIVTDLVNENVPHGCCGGCL